MSDIGMETSVKIIDELRTKIKKEKIEDEDDVKKAKDTLKIITPLTDFPSQSITDNLKSSTNLETTFS